MPASNESLDPSVGRRFLGKVAALKIIVPYGLTGSFEEKNFSGGHLVPREQ